MRLAALARLRLGASSVGACKGCRWFNLARTTGVWRIALATATETQVKRVAGCSGKPPASPPPIMALPTKISAYCLTSNPTASQPRPLERFGCPRHPTAALRPAPRPALPRPTATLQSPNQPWRGRVEADREGVAALVPSRLGLPQKRPFRSGSRTILLLRWSRPERIGFLRPLPGRPCYPPRPFFSSIFLGQQKNGPRREGMEQCVGRSPARRLSRRRRVLWSERASPAKRLSPPARRKKRTRSHQTASCFYAPSRTTTK
ncbi:hypothetical protein DND132_1993 [Pseudodesulfovibrio mercurii]|uniref:Uncharacterized protein n=1 Tax=Pseudodesulfovibrio mercurii TaxID=641491 RepID=F0JH84_9BACT|nr:hypothetical protein DND132_1993 [Pseudodesulfovibrio mercurii]